MSRRIGTGLVRGGIGILVSIACLFLVLRGVDLGRTADLLGGARPAWLLLAVAGILADLFFRALRWQILVAPIRRVPLRRLSAYMLVGYLANNVLPARLGELVRSHYLGDREGISRSATLGTVVVERVVDTVVLVGIGRLRHPGPERARRRGQRDPRGRGPGRPAVRGPGRGPGRPPTARSGESGRLPGPLAAGSRTSSAACATGSAWPRCPGPWLPPRS